MGRGFLRLLAGVVLLLAVFWTVRDNRPASRTIPYSQFIELVDGGYVQSGVFDKDTFQGKTFPNAPSSPNATFTVNLPPANSRPYDVAVEKLLSRRVTFEFRRPWISEGMTAVFLSVLLPLGFVAFIWMYFLKQARRPGQSAR